MCVPTRQGRENSGCFLVLLQYCIICIVVVWMAVCLTGYSDYLTGFREPLSTSYIILSHWFENYRNHWQSFGLFVIMMQWSLLYTLYDCHDNISTEGFLRRFFFVACMFHSGICLAPTAQLLLLVLLFVLGAPFSSEISCLFFFFLMSVLASSLFQWFCLFACSGILWVKNGGPLC